MSNAERFHTLSDGRRICFCEYGDPAGAAVFALHGTPGSRLKFSLAHREAQRLGLRLISPDRWGYGLSDAPVGRPVLGDYPDDVLALADHLGLGRFGVVGISGGGPFATAIAARLGGRVAALALVAPVSPVDDRNARRGISLFHRFAFRGLPRLPGAIPLAFQYFRGALYVSPWWAVRAMASRAGAPDRVLLRDPEVAGDLVRTFRAGLALGVKGAAIDMRCFSRAWGIDVSCVRAPGRMWLGMEDRNVPLGAARAMGKAMPNMHVEEISGAGHFWVTKAFPEVLSWLAAELQPNEAFSGSQVSTPSLAVGTGADRSRA